MTKIDLDLLLAVENDEHGETAIDIAYVAEADDIVALLEKHGARVKDP